MRLDELKEKLGITTFNLNTATKEDGSKYQDKEGGEWMRHWDNDQRLAVSFPKDLVKELAEDKEGKIATLGMQTEMREGEQGEYRAVRVVKYTEAELTL